MKTPLLCTALALLGATACAPGDTTEPVTRRDTIQVVWRTPVSDAGSGLDDLAIDGRAFYTLVNGVSAYDLQTGALLWRVPRPAGRPLNLLTHNGRVFVPASDVFAVEATTGAELWRVTPDSFGRVEAAVDDKALYIGTDNRRVIAYDVATGRTLWSREVLAPTTYPSSVNAIVAHGDTVYAAVLEWLNQSGGRKRGWMFALDRNTGRVLWTFLNERADEPHDVGNHAVAGRMLLINDLNGSAMIGVDRFTGVEVWRRVSSSGYLGAWDTFKVVDDVAYVASNDTYLYALDPESGRIKWQTPLQASASSSVVCGDKVFAGAYGLHRANRSDGKVTATLFLDAQGVVTGSYVRSRLQTWANRVYFVGNDGVYAVKCD
ncbi:MAG TPA: PQQ-binding-like beta-propeller repeat protein [Longimicrobium sp.]|jgi:outer membrane protein assembly factor BamB|uniref:PQQ-binding-like beta-propeller repeat protein n=1 Tax=Longimicrobium sp. TaxID=2029185 RepID=UPI002EDB3CA1